MNPLYQALLVPVSRSPSIEQARQHLLRNECQEAMNALCALHEDSTLRCAMIAMTFEMAGNWDQASLFYTAIADKDKLPPSIRDVVYRIHERVADFFHSFNRPLQDHELHLLSRYQEPKSFFWLEAENGDPVACCNMGTVLEHEGKGSIAHKYHIIAAATGYLPGIERVVKTYLLKGQFLEAYRWFKKGVDQGQEAWEAWWPRDSKPLNLIQIALCSLLNSSDKASTPLGMLTKGILFFSLGRRREGFTLIRGSVAFGERAWMDEGGKLLAYRDFFIDHRNC